MLVDLFLVYQFVRRLATSFEKWDAFKEGVIDKDGKILIKKKDRTRDQKKTFGLFDLMVLNMKKLLGKLPGGSSKIASYAAALFLIKEYKVFTDESMLTEDMSEEDLTESISIFNDLYVNYTMLAENVNINMNEAVKKVAVPKWTKSGPNGEKEITFSTGRRFQLEKQYDENDRHKGEWKIMEWDSRSRDWEWMETYSPLWYAKEKVMKLGQYDSKGKKVTESAINIKPELEEEPANNVSGGNIAGMDAGHMSKAGQQKWTSKNKTTKKKRLRDIMGVTQ